MKIEPKNNRRRAQLLRRYRGRIAKCHSGRYGRVTGVQIDAKGRPVFTGHHVDAAVLEFCGEKTLLWRDWNGIPWQSVKPVWVEE